LCKAPVTTTFIYWSYIPYVYTKMKDIYDTTIICNKCNKKTEKGTIQKEGFSLRCWKCPQCGEVWVHPGDMKEYENFQKVKQKQFQVKLRMVGNSYTVSIPREIVDFGEIKKDEIVKVSMDQPEKVILFFSKTTRRIIKKE